MNIEQIYWLVLGLVLGGMLVGAFFSGRESLRRQIAGEIPALNKRELRSASAKVRNGWWANWLQGVSTEMVGAVVTTILLGTVVGAVQQQRLIAQQKEELILQMGSPDHAFAVEAARILGAHGWGSEADSTLQGAMLYGANLQGANLFEANLQGVTLDRANLQGATLIDANLQEATLNWANLQEVNMTGVDLLGANLIGANLEGADLHWANLQSAYLPWINLQRANLEGANLQGTILLEAKFDEETTLPDGSNWTPDADMARFTDPDHPAFWQGFGLAWRDLHDRDFRQANLQGANMRNADLRGANLEGANLQGANLQGANLNFAEFDEKTILPDGSTWTPNTDMTRFTNPDHPDFWRSDDPLSPAYRGDEDDD